MILAGTVTRERAEEALATLKSLQEVRDKFEEEFGILESYMANDHEIEFDEEERQYLHFPNYASLDELIAEQEEAIAEAYGEEWR